MIKKISLILFAFIVIVSAQSISPTFSIRLLGGYNTYKMSDLVKLQETIVTGIRSDIDIPVKAVESFPAYYNFQLQLFLLSYNSYSFGVMYDYASTGGRIHYSDYSGQIKIDQLVFQKSFGGILKKTFTDSGSVISGALNLKGFLIWSQMEYSEFLEIGSSSDETSYTFKSFSLGIEPAIDFFVNMDGFLVGMEMGYRLVVPTDFTLESNSDATLENNGDSVKAQWNGFNVSLCLGINLSNGN